jgi:hypothetical protein
MSPEDGVKEFAISSFSAWYILIVCTLLYMAIFDFTEKVKQHFIDAD